MDEPKAFQAPDQNNSGLFEAAQYLGKIGRVESRAQILARMAREDPSTENLKAWLDSAQQMYDAEDAAKAWAALDRLLKERGDSAQRRDLARRRMRFLHKQSDTIPRVAGIMDEFTTASFRPECIYLPLLPKDAVRQLEYFKPDFVFVESAWHGNDSAWTKMVSTVSRPLREMLAWCRDNGVPSVFWNKEDPVHFSVFLDAASLCDFVFTTDIDCIPAYKHALGHDRIFLLPFAAQPQQHNPIATMQRKDAFNFAGSYYLRYPERQRDIAAILDTVRELRPVEIYDRNHGKNHPHYQFPDEYQSMILGRLPFSDIDKAYKGYRYGINLNTIKQSQTMFARRVFELMASNTVVVSNFSRGVRMMFGDLVICSDKRDQLAKPLEMLAGEDLQYRKYRLQGLRKVMREHTYADRLAYILSKIRGEPFEPVLPRVALFARAGTQEETDAVLAAFERQTHPEKHLYLLLSNDLPVPAHASVSAFTEIEGLLSALEKPVTDFTFWGLLHADDYYGANYLTDLVLTSRYSDAAGFGKGCRYRLSGTAMHLENEAGRYQAVESLPLRAALLRRAHLTAQRLTEAMEDPGTTCAASLPLFGIDEFNYCLEGRRSADAEDRVSDSDLPFQGLSTTDLYDFAETLAPAKTRMRAQTGAQPTLKASAFFSAAVISRSMPLVKKMQGERMQVTRDVDPGKAAYLWMRNKLSRTSLNLVDQSTLHFEIKHDLKEVHLVCEFYDEKGHKLSHSMLGHSGSHALAIPRECTQLRFGLRIDGTGTLTLSDIVFGADSALPPVILGPSDTLVLTKHYPAYDDLYKYGFLHSRVRAYRESGIGVDIFRLNMSAKKTYSEFENIDVASGDAELLKATLKTGKYRHVLVHMIDPAMWTILKDFLDDIRVTIWIHGAEIQHWQRRAYEFPRMTDEQVTQKKRRTAIYLALWREIFERNDKNVHLVFVSHTQLKEATEDVGMAPADSAYSVIHNYADPQIFSYVPKTAEQRCRILSVRPYSSETYANDLTVAAIQELSTRPFFDELSFTLVGSGELFEPLTAPLREFPNVELREEFVPHEEIAALHKSHGVFLVPTRMDSQGLSRDEAMSSGLVPVTTRVAAVPEFVDESCGFLAPPEDHKALADAIETLYNDPARFLRMSEAASRRVRMQSGFDKTIARELKLIGVGARVQRETK